jgi:hypothetical protein
MKGTLLWRFRSHETLTVPECLVQNMAKYAELSRILPRESESNLVNRLECGNSKFPMSSPETENATGFALSRSANLLPTFKSAMWGRG